MSNSEPRSPEARLQHHLPCGFTDPTNREATNDIDYSLSSPVVEFTTTKGIHVLIPTDEWLERLRAINAALDGGGFTLYLPPLSPIADEVSLLVAIPSNALGEPRFEGASLFRGDTAATAIASVVETPNGELVNHNFIDLGLSSNRRGLKMLVDQPYTNVLNIHPSTGQVLGCRHMDIRSVRDDLRELLNLTRDCRPMTDLEAEVAFHDITRVLNGPITHPPAGSRVGRNQPCPCGSGVKSKRCCAR